MTTTVEAVYEHGVLKPKRPLALRDGETVEVIVVSREDAGGQAAGNPAELLAGLAALPMEGDQAEFAGRDHDAALYGAHKRA